MSIRLRELFACTEQGGAFVAESADGRLLHIGEVPSGLACNCVCPGCGRRMVAKKGDVQAHHFAHNAQQDGRSCASAGETALKNELARAVSSALAGLPADYRVVITLCDIEGLPNSEAAAMMKISLPALKSKLHRARLQLKEQLKDFR